MDIEDHLADAVVDGTAEAGLRLLPKIDLECNAIIVGNTDIMLDDVLGLQEVKGAAMLLNVAIRNQHKDRREVDREVKTEEIAREAGGHYFRTSMYSMPWKEMNIRLIKLETPS